MSSGHDTVRPDRIPCYVRREPTKSLPRWSSLPFLHLIPTDLPLLDCQQCGFSHVRLENFSVSCAWAIASVPARQKPVELPRRARRSTDPSTPLSFQSPDTSQSNVPPFEKLIDIKSDKKVIHVASAQEAGYGNQRTEFTDTTSLHNKEPTKDVAEHVPLGPDPASDASSLPAERTVKRKPRPKPFRSSAPTVTTSPTSAPAHQSTTLIPKRPSSHPMRPYTVTGASFPPSSISSVPITSLHSHTRSHSQSNITRLGHPSRPYYTAIRPAMSRPASPVDIPPRPMTSMSARASPSPLPYRRMSHEDYMLNDLGDNVQPTPFEYPVPVTDNKSSHGRRSIRRWLRSPFEARWGRVSSAQLDSQRRLALDRDLGRTTSHDSDFPESRLSGGMDLKTPIMFLRSTLRNAVAGVKL